MSLWAVDPVFRDPFRMFDRVDPFRSSPMTSSLAGGGIGMDPLRGFDDYVRNRINEAFADFAMLPMLTEPTTTTVGTEAGGTAPAPAAVTAGTTTDVGAGQLMMRPPRLDVTEREKDYILKMDLPGMSKEQVDIKIDKDFLTIEGERREEHESRTPAGEGVEQSQFQQHIIERSFGKFRRRLRLPMDANHEQVSAKMENGVLELCINKKAEAVKDQAVRRIEVQ